MSSSTDPTESSVQIGWISRAHGIRGEVVVVSDSSDAVFAVGRRLTTDQRELLTIGSVRHGKHGRIVAFDEIADRTAAEAMRGRTLSMAAGDRRTLETDEYWPEDLVGLTVVDGAGREMGTVVEVILGEAQDRLVVSTSSGRVEIPFVDALVPAVDPSTGHIHIDPPPGLFTSAES